MAENLVAHFASLGGVISASRWAVIRESSTTVAALLDAHRAFLEHSLRNRLLDGTVTASGRALEEYLVATMGDGRTERLRALFLDAGNRLLSDELIVEGDATWVGVSARTVINRALDVQASALILVHNHPGGQAEPSKADVAFTAKVAEAGRHLAINLHDHLIVAGSQCVSLRKLGLI